MNIGNAFPSAYIKAADLQGRSAIVTMDRVVMEDIGGDQKPILYFLGKDRGLPLNKTNANIVAEMYGWETDNWQGNPITLYPARVEFQGKIVDAVRVKLMDVAAKTQPPQQPRPAQNGASPAPTPQPAKTQSFEKIVDDEIPF